MTLTQYTADAEKDVGMKKLKLEEAITILQDMKVDIPVPKAAVMQTKRNVAIDMAIDALKCSEMPNSSQCISRQEAIDALRNINAIVSPISDDVLLIDKAEAQTELMMLPPVEPKRGRWHYSDGKPATIGRSFGVICDQCGTESEYCTNFCGECGADMRGDDDE